MYHYVRRLGEGDFPDIKGLEIEKFQRQLDHIVNNYTVISMENAIDALINNLKLPEHPVLLTFDDGYIDHFQTVFPILQEMELPGAFFPPTCAIIDRKLLNVNKIHLVLATTSSQEKKDIYYALIEKMQKSRERYQLKSIDGYIKQYATDSRYDNKYVMFIKRMLQFFLPLELRQTICSELLFEFTGKSEKELAEMLYMKQSHLEQLVSGGMHVGGHGATHQWLSKISPEEQEEEIVASKELLKNIGVNPDYLTFCYPYGDSDSVTHSILNKHNFKLGFTTVPQKADFSFSNALTLERLDTNQLPQ
jgi:peptidoglycan/xylan/chitin deacetylase (PgdA/CDA1 family)